MDRHEPVGLLEFGAVDRGQLAAGVEPVDVRGGIDACDVGDPVSCLVARGQLERAAAEHGAFAVLDDAGAIADV